MHGWFSVLEVSLMRFVTSLYLYLLIVGGTLSFVVVSFSGSIYFNTQPSTNKMFCCSLLPERLDRIRTSSNGGFPGAVPPKLFFVPREVMTLIAGDWLNRNLKLSGMLTCLQTRASSLSRPATPWN